MNEDLAVIVERARDDALSVDQQHSAFAELVSRFEERAFGWALQLLGDPEEARDACQDGFVAAWLKLRTLRDAAAFSVWLKRLIATQCSRRLRKRRETQDLDDHDLSAGTQVVLEQRERQRILAHAIARLPESEHRIVVLFYFLGRTINEIASILAMPRGTVGKRLHSARIFIRRRLPGEIRKDFLAVEPAPRFLQKVREGLFDEYVGKYRFRERPDHVVRVEREGPLLVSYGGGQRNVLASLRDDALITMEFDGEGCFQRNRAGRITGFVYYEFGARLGVAQKCRA